jgi:tetratricopeptide (TPR) repeat protein
MREETRDLTIGEALDLGCQMALAGRNLDAIGLFKGVLIHEPENFEAMERLGSSLFELKRYHEALYYFWRGRKLCRRHPLALTNYGLTVSQLGHWEEGLAELQKAVAIIERGKHEVAPAVKSLVYNNLGNALQRVEKFAEALAYLDKGIALNPQDHFPHYNRGVALLRLNRHKEAVASLDRCLTLKPNDQEALYNRSMGRLLLGDMQGGFADYDARLLTSENTVVNLGLPADKKWDGGDLAGKTILVHCEQGLGDDIQFLRFLPALREKNPARILLVPHSAITPMIAPMEGMTIRPSGVPIDFGEFDCWVALMSLPHYLGLDQETLLPASWQPVIEPSRIAAWRMKLDLDAKRLKVGVCWAGNWLHKNDKHRSIPLAKFAPLFDAMGVTFVSLQQLRPGENKEFDTLVANNTDLRSFYFDDFRDTAAAMLNLDMVISVDTSVAHLAATLGIPTKVLVPAFGTDWRWGLGRSDSPWYRSATIYRQPKVGDWVSVIDKLRAELTRQAMIWPA